MYLIIPNNETGRWADIPQHERICRFCQVHIGNKFHFLFVCKHPQITALRHKYYTVNPSENKMCFTIDFNKSFLICI
jgi:hypothetical protein